jgi:hypothetical protein
MAVTYGHRERLGEQFETHLNSKVSALASKILKSIKS